MSNHHPIIREGDRERRKWGEEEEGGGRGEVEGEGRGGGGRRESRGEEGEDISAFNAHDNTFAVVPGCCVRSELFLSFPLRLSASQATSAAWTGNQAALPAGPALSTASEPCGFQVLNYME